MSSSVIVVVRHGMSSSVVVVRHEMSSSVSCCC